MRKICYLLLSGFIFALTGDELAQKMDSREIPIDSKVDLFMTLTNKKGKTRSFSLHSINKNNGEKQIIWFLSPADDKGISLLKIEYDNRDDEMYMWLPAFKKIRRISTKKRSDSFMGSDMSYEDLSSREQDEYNFSIKGQEIYEGTSCYLLECIPKEYIRTEYSQHITWVDSSLLIPLKEKSYDKSGQLLKEKYFSYTVIKEYHILTKIYVNNIQKNHSTTLDFENIELNIGLSDDLFHERYLKRLPK